MKIELNYEELKAKGEMTPIPGFTPEMYLCHCPSGNVYSIVSAKWLLQGNPRGTGDNGQYLMTSLRDKEGNYHPMYLHEIVMSSYMGMMKADWRAMGLEVDHISKNTKDCSIGNLRLATSAANKKNSSDRHWNKIRLTKDTAVQLREDFNKWTGSKVEWYQIKGRELGVTARSIQNVILGNTYKVN